MSLKVSDAYELVSKKILVNKMSVENLKNQIDFSTKFIKFQVENAKIAHAKIKLVKSLNNILENQLREFTPERQEACMDLYNQINAFDLPTTDHCKMLSDCHDCERRMIELQEKIAYIESTMPNEQLVTNYNVNVEQKEPPSTCAKDAMGMQ
jgi:valyl-tRNA synthetase